MKRPTTSIAALLRVTRVALVVGGIADVWLIVLLTRAMEPDAALNRLPLVVALLLAMGVSLGLHLFGTTLNDLLDARHDRMFQPDRPIASGHFSPAAALLLAPAALLMAIICAIPFGTTATVVCLTCAMATLFYDAAAKHFPAAGVVTLGLIRAGHMFIPNPDLMFCWPVWLAMTHIIGISAAAYVLEHKRPKLSGMQLWGLIAGWAFWSLALIGWMTYQRGLKLHDAPMIWLGPIVAVAGFAAFASWCLPQIPRGRDAGRSLMRMGWLWLIIYDVAWLGSAGLWWQAVLVGSLLGAALGLMELTRTLGRAVDSSEYRVEEHAG